MTSSVGRPGEPESVQPPSFPEPKKDSVGDVGEETLKVSQGEGVPSLSGRKTTREIPEVLDRQVKMTLEIMKNRYHVEVEKAEIKSFLARICDVAQYTIKASQEEREKAQRLVEYTVSKEYIPVISDKHLVAIQNVLEKDYGIKAEGVDAESLLENICKQSLFFDEQKREEINQRLSEHCSDTLYFVNKDVHIAAQILKAVILLQSGESGSVEDAFKRAAVHVAHDGCYQVNRIRKFFIGPKPGEKRFGRIVRVPFWILLLISAPIMLGISFGSRIWARRQAKKMGPLLPDPQSPQCLAYDMAKEKWNTLGKNYLNHPEFGWLLEGAPRKRTFSYDFDLKGWCEKALQFLAEAEQEINKWINFCTLELYEDREKIVQGIVVGVFKDPRVSENRKASTAGALLGLLPMMGAGSKTQTLHTLTKNQENLRELLSFLDSPAETEEQKFQLDWYSSDWSHIREKLRNGEFNVLKDSLTKVAEKFGKVRKALYELPIDCQQNEFLNFISSGSEERYKQFGEAFVKYEQLHTMFGNWWEMDFDLIERKYDAFLEAVPPHERKNYSGGEGYEGPDGREKLIKDSGHWAKISRQNPNLQKERYKEFKQLIPPWEVKSYDPVEFKTRYGALINWWKTVVLDPKAEISEPVGLFLRRSLAYL